MKLAAVVLSMLISSAALAATPAAPANPHAGMPMQGNSAAPAIDLTETAKVVSTIDVPQYTYIEISQGKTTRWLAAATVKVKKGDTIRFDPGMVMSNFHSKSLNRTFPSIAFVNRVAVGNAK